MDKESYYHPWFFLVYNSNILIDILGEYTQLKKQDNIATNFLSANFRLGIKNPKNQSTDQLY